MRCVLVLAALLLASCTRNDKPLCTPGASVACVGIGGCSGGQVCNADGSALSACDCGTVSDAGTDPPDSGVQDPLDASTEACNLVTQTGCPTDQRCGWIRIAENLAIPGCVPIGSAGVMDSCLYGPDGETTGHDDCQKGLVCLSGRCLAACRTDDPNACSSGFACVKYAGFDDGTQLLGGCGPTCNPVTQTRDFDGALACGSPNPTVPTLGCYGAPGGTFSCAPAGDSTKTHRVDAATGGFVYLNSCAPGYAPLLRRSSADPSPVCIAFCSPAESYSGSSASIAGTAPHTCPARGASAPEECRFFWFLEPLEDGARILSPYSNGVGFCFDPTQYLLWDDDNNSATPNVASPSCAVLSNTPPADGGVPDHRTWGCAPWP
jgi:hypothetical protein